MMCHISVVCHLILHLHLEPSDLQWYFRQIRNLPEAIIFIWILSVKRIEYKSAIRMHEQGGWTFQYDVELERPVELIPNQTYSMEIFVDESVMEVYVNDEVAMSVRAYDLHDRKFGLAVSDGTVCFENIQLTTVGE